ncbi:MAG: hypothetical protein B7Y86_03105 [Brevundimonas subvibrioides]|uniref:Uncharacterized protein n=1 Tax=Brevundimonas subvibrioides TaxID=74313 RepID=A0A258HN46_9CAUL|nr:MAG: hypothetical protein B7Y86_03105 [Brevundimonas subvibrioides]
MVDAYQRVNSQLVQFAGVERQVFGNVDEEADALVRLFKQSTSSDLVEALAVYHNRRMDAAPLLILEAEAGRAVRPPDS